MRKKKENIVINTDPDAPKSEGLETEREERYEEIAGETATEGMGPGYTNEPGLEKSIQTGDGPLEGESIAPPFRTGRAQGKRRRRRAVGRHAAARSSKKI